MTSILLMCILVYTGTTSLALFISYGVLLWRTRDQTRLCASG